jgi:hypothetical protein
VCIKSALQRGQIPIPFSTNPRNMLSNLLGVISEPLSESDIEAIAKQDRSCRLIKGQVFLWKDNQSWEDLWDVNGVITPRITERAVCQRPRVFYRRDRIRPERALWGEGFSAAGPHATGPQNRWVIVGDCGNV